ncbi:SGNH/GDSL hydrolase family protein [Pseudoroseicyclus tamaricis]|uniref:SGNH/GDSL hydrolase family protein n=1 Tax=Pseudoroseicyclus tamaricis TaxID=2705421 RepID=A0A6B2K6W2_9RHOB|nr:SGNH/GDSL hydrolase family protein [Pseudoroseicyclus tamaricis]NDV02676.1 SGNH/GDSL hydrolase family protein [Pseudoroseicyclus tamaricis]
MKRILCYGDSNTWGADPEGGGRFDHLTRWTGVLQARLGEGYTVIEEGLGGRTTVRDDPYEPWRNGRTYLVPCLLSHHPLDLVVLMLGTNDMKTRFNVPASDIARGVKLLVQDIRATLGAGMRVLIVAPAPVGAHQKDHPSFGDMLAGSYEKSRQLAPLYLAAAEELGTGFFDAGTVCSLDHGDSVHLGRRDHAALGEALAEVVPGLL